MADNGQVVAFVWADQAFIQQTEDTHVWRSAFTFIEGGLDTTPPVVGSFSPALGGTIPANQPISFSVADDRGAFRRVIVHARFADGLEEVVFNGETFRGLYGGGASTRTIAVGGFDFTILRTGGWPQGGPVAINVFATDEGGNESA